MRAVVGEVREHEQREQTASDADEDAPTTALAAGAGRDDRRGGERE